MMSRYQTALEKASIPLDSKQTTAKDRAKTIIIEENAKYYKSSFGGNR